jgi:hypothetical protein
MPPRYAPASGVAAAYCCSASQAMHDPDAAQAVGLNRRASCQSESDAERCRPAASARRVGLMNGDEQVRTEQTHTRRYLEIGSALRRHGLGFLVGLLGLDRMVAGGRGAAADASRKASTESPAHLRAALEELGPTFIKVGQLLSTRSDLLPPAFVAELALPRPESGRSCRSSGLGAVRRMRKHPGCRPIASGWGCPPHGASGGLRFAPPGSRTGFRLCRRSRWPRAPR